MVRATSLALGASLVVLLGALPAAAQLDSVGSEAAIGANGTGEPCRARVVFDDAARGLTRVHVYCDGWRASSGTLFRFRVARDTAPARLLTDST